MIMIGMVSVVESNYWGFSASLGIILLGALILMGIQSAYHVGISGMAYMVGTGLGMKCALYTEYIVLISRACMIVRKHVGRF